MTVPAFCGACPRFVAPLLLTMLIAAASPAQQQAYFSTTGTFSNVGGYFTDYNFSLPATSDTTFRTWGWAGGTNAAGQNIPAGGVDSVLTLLNSANVQVAQNIDIGPGQNDSLIVTPGLAGGNYRLRLQPQSLGDGHWATDLASSSGPMTLRSIALSANTSFLDGISFGGVNRAILQVSSPLTMSGELRMNAGAQLDLGPSLITAGSLTLNGANSQVNWGPGGSLSVGRLNINAGTFDAPAQLLRIGQGGATQTFSMSGGTLNAALLNIGYDGFGTGTQSAGRAQPTSVELGTQAGSTGQYRQNGGTLAVSSTTPIGVEGAGTFFLGGGTHTAGTLILGSTSIGNGTYVVGTGTFSAANQIIGRDGAGSLIIGDGRDFATSITVAANPGSRGYCSFDGFGQISATTLTINAGGELRTGLGRYLVAHTILQGGLIGGNALGSNNISFGHGAPASCDMSAGTVSASNLDVGFTSNGTFTQAGGIVSTVNLTVATAPGVVGRYVLNNGTIGADTIQLGFGGQGTLEQNGGAIAADHLYAGSDQGTGNFILSGGVASFATDAWSGRASTGTITVNGGTFQTGQLYAGSNTGVAGTITLNGGTVVTDSAQINPAGQIMLNGTFAPSRFQFGTLDVNGGTLTNAGTQGIVVGVGLHGAQLNLNSGAVGAFVLNVGTLDGIGTMTQGGGTFVGLPSVLSIGGSGMSMGYYALTGGTVNFSNVAVGESSIGTFSQTGGIVQTGTVVLAKNPGASGTYLLSGGTFTPTRLFVNSGGTFTFSGGRFNAGPVTVSGVGSLVMSPG